MYIDTLPDNTPKPVASDPKQTPAAAKAAHAVVIYTRYSTEQQRPTSCTDQEREVRQVLRDRYRINSTDALVLADEAESGIRDTRTHFDDLMAQVHRGEVRVLAVDDQARFSRGVNVRAMIQDLIFRDGHFISTGEGIDTDEPGWEMKVDLMQIHHNTSSRETARRVRRGQVGRAMSADGSAGDYPLGFGSVPAVDDWEAYVKSGKKVPRRLVVEEEQAETVRLIFDLYANQGVSMTGIARMLNGRGVNKSARAQTPTWQVSYISGVLRQKKYIGIWTWGVTEQVRDAKGNARVRPARLRPPVTTLRPKLRIISDALWEKAQARRKVEADARAKRGRGLTGMHPRHRYPRCNLGGLIQCGHCGRRLSLVSGQSTTRERRNRPFEKYFLKCTNPGHPRCPQTRWVPVPLVEDALYGFLKQLCADTPAWVHAVTAAIESAVRQARQNAPAEQRRLKERLGQTQSRIRNLVNQISDGASGSRALAQRLAELEADEQALLRELKNGGSLQCGPQTMPDTAWVVDQLGRMAQDLKAPSPRMAALLKRVFPRVTLEAIHRPLASRPQMQLRVRTDLKGLLSDADSPLLAALSLSSGGESEVVLNATQPLLAESFLPQMLALRLEGATNMAIGRAMGTSSMPAASAFPAFRKLMSW